MVPWCVGRRVSTGWLSTSAATVVLFALLGFPAQYARPDAGASDDPSHRVESLVRDWYALLARQPVESCAVDDLVKEAPVVFSLAGGSVSGPDALQAWVSELRSAYPQVDYQLEVVRIDFLDDGTCRATFELNRRALDADKMSHIARRKQTWTIRGIDQIKPEVLRIDEQRLLSFPGTGPQIVCY